jgi:hypothetical protein
VIRKLTKSVSAASVLAAALFFGAGAAAAAAQDPGNRADSGAANASGTSQHGNQDQNASSTSGNSGCWSYCTGGGGNITPQSQDLGQWANTEQFAASAGIAGQHAVNANVPVTIVGEGNVWGGSSGGAHQDLHNSASSAAANASSTRQHGDQSQNADSSSGNDGCSKFCTGGGGNITPQEQQLGQKANTEQAAASIALAKQHALNANVPVTIVGWGDVKHGSDGWGGANQNAWNSASSAAANASSTNQHGNQSQNSDTSSGNDGGGHFVAGGGGNIAPQAQSLFQGSNTVQAAESAALAGQWLNNANAGVGIGG